ncbi:MAG: glycosyltransferase [Acidimicrobiaceae bacterium]|nr:glycosyltransferase [Acidimicrobiaceae bacterium]
MDLSPLPDVTPPTPPAPGPAKVDGNDWKSLDTASLEEFEPRLQATVVVPYYEAPDALALTLAGLERQSYPRHLFEVIVVDDGSDPPLEMPGRSPLNVRVIHQPDLGFGLARARNNGARAAQGDIVVFLDCDMIPAREWLAAHARWHHAASDAVSIGFRRHLDVTGVEADDVRHCSGTLDEMFTDRPWDRPEWIESHMARTAELTSDDDDLFRVASGGNLGMSRHFYWEVGGNDESFTQWGAEDIEFGYRAFTLGALLVPERRALCWHQGTGTVPSSAEARSLEQQQAKLSHLIAHYGFRGAKPGRSFTVPQYVVSVDTGGAGTDAQLDTVERLLSGDVHDLVVWIEQRQPADEEEAHAAEIVRRLLGGDPRVRFGPRGGAPSAFAASQFHIFVKAGTPVAPNLVSGLRKQLGAAECTTAPQPDGSIAILVRARRLHRELRWGLDGESITAASLASRLLPRPTATTPIGEPGRPDDGGVAPGVSSPAAIREPALAAGAERLPRLQKLGRIAAYTATEARAVRRPGDAARLARTVGGWIVRAAGWRLRWIAWRLRRAALQARRVARRGAAAVRRSAKGRMRSTEIRPVTYRLGPSIAACGPRSAAVFAAWTGLHTKSSVPAQVVLCDDMPLPSTWTPKAGAAVIPLTGMAPTAATPAFDAEQVNPARWPAALRRAASLGPKSSLPAGHKASRRVDAANVARARRYHHLADVAAYHADAQARAGAVAALAASGAVVRLCDGGVEVAGLLGERLFALLTDPRIETASEAEREALSVEMRREALRTHSLRARARQVCEAASMRTEPLPLVSVLLATRRPDQVAEAVASVAAQTYPRIELVLAAHGDGFDRARLETLVAGSGTDAHVLTVPAGFVLGEVLNQALEHSRGELVTKFDDDDFYGPEHVWDLVLAHEYSRATLVGKAAEYVYLEGADRTLRRFRGSSERFGSKLTLAGGAMIIARSDLDAVVGWQPVPAGVDRALMGDVVAGGGSLYRTHGRGYLLVRHARGHTWEADDEYFLEQAVEVHDGCDLRFAGVV